MKKAVKIVLLTVFFITFTVALNSVIGQPMPAAIHRAAERIHLSEDMPPSAAG